MTNLQGNYACEIDKTDNITGGTGDASAVADDATRGWTASDGSTVWAWTGDDEDEVDVDDTEVYRLDIPGGIL